MPTTQPIRAAGSRAVRETLDEERDELKPDIPDNDRSLVGISLVVFAALYFDFDNTLRSLRQII